MSTGTYEVEDAWLRGDDWGWYIDLEGKMLYEDDLDRFWSDDPDQEVWVDELLKDFEDMCELDEDYTVALLEAKLAERERELKKKTETNFFIDYFCSFLF